MFTGIVEEVGTLVAREDGADSAVLRIRAQRVLEDVKLGDSIAVSGVCLTVTAVEGDVWSTDVMAETLRRSSLGAAEAGVDCFVAGSAVYGADDPARAVEALKDQARKAM